MDSAGCVNKENTTYVVLAVAPHPTLEERAWCAYVEEKKFLRRERKGGGGGEEC